MTKVVEEEMIFFNASVSNNEEILEQLGNKAIELGFAKPNYVEGLKQRENEFATGVPVEPTGVAIPHTDSSYVNDNKVAVMTLKDPIEFNQMGGAETDKLQVKLVILLCFKDGKNHMSALQNIIEKIQDEKFVESLVNADSKETLLKISKSNFDNIL
ncbi:PTS sugar transporter subunit IIA [Staphylococcus kloosii]|jgi:PTS system galactitol-specific IIA component|uniref:PTS sugar transporter subunit IIA n=1 Tax=Staphylococcus kloosii TaxID=29384 RepID=UPI00189C86B3|nr:PTS sugar transporter subunit IIA [Staphylococcus kloosii]MBF7030095.1 PTS sugar transporter subunit IIA [Staphylococcus kloosii]